MNKSNLTDSDLKGMSEIHDFETFLTNSRNHIISTMPSNNAATINNIFVDDMVMGEFNSSIVLLATVYRRLTKFIDYLDKLEGCKATLGTLKAQMIKNNNLGAHNTPLDFLGVKTKVMSPFRDFLLNAISTYEYKLSSRPHEHLTNPSVKEKAVYWFKALDSIGHGRSLFPSVRCEEQILYGASFVNNVLSNVGVKYDLVLDGSLGLLYNGLMGQHMIDRFKKGVILYHESTTEILHISDIDLSLIVDPKDFDKIKSILDARPSIGKNIYNPDAYQLIIRVPHIGTTIIDIFLQKKDDKFEAPTSYNTCLGLHLASPKWTISEKIQNHKFKVNAVRSDNGLSEAVRNYYIEKISTYSSQAEVMIKEKEEKTNKLQQVAVNEPRVKGCKFKALIKKLISVLKFK